MLVGVLDRTGDLPAIARTPVFECEDFLPDPRLDGFLGNTRQLKRTSQLVRSTFGEAPPVLTRTHQHVPRSQRTDTWDDKRVFALPQDGSAIRVQLKESGQEISLLSPGDLVTE